MTFYEQSISHTSLCFQVQLHNMKRYWRFWHILWHFKFLWVTYLDNNYWKAVFDLDLHTEHKLGVQMSESLLVPLLEALWWRPGGSNSMNQRKRKMIMILQKLTASLYTVINKYRILWEHSLKYIGHVCRVENAMVTKNLCLVKQQKLTIMSHGSRSPIYFVFRLNKLREQWNQGKSPPSCSGNTLARLCDNKDHCWRNLIQVQAGTYILYKISTVLEWPLGMVWRASYSIVLMQSKLC